jgi:hypothetical protein
VIQALWPLKLADLGRDRPPYTTELERAAEVCDSGSDLSDPPAGKYQPVGPMGGRWRYASRLEQRSQVKSVSNC